MNRVFVAIDVSNIYYSTKKRFGPERKLNYRKIVEYCRKMGWVYRQTCYSSDMNGKGEEFFNCLKHIGFEVKLKPVKSYIEGEILIEKANCDIEMVIDIVRYAEHFDQLILMSADGDMIPVVKYCQDRGITVHVLACAINSDLREAADSWEEITPVLLERANEVANNA